MSNMTATDDYRVRVLRARADDIPAPDGDHITPAAAERELRRLGFTDDNTAASGETKATA